MTSHVLGKPPNEKQRAVNRALEEKNNGADWTPTWLNKGNGEWVDGRGYWDGRGKHFACSP